MGKLHIIDISIVGIYLLLCLAIGLYKSTKIKTIKEYAVGNRNFSTFTIIATIFATFISAGTTIGKVEGTYDFGLLYGLALFFTPLNWLLVKNIYAKNIGQFKSCISMSEIMQKLYGNCGSYITSFILISKSIGVMVISVTAMGYLFNYFFGLDYEIGIAIGIGILTIYSLLGGVRAVALTDVFQFLVFFIALPISCGMAYFKAGGYSNITNSIPKSHLTIFSNADSTILFFGYIFLIVTPAVSAPYVQRLLMARDTKQLTRSFNVLMALSFFFAVITFALGFSIKTIFPDIEGKMAFYTFIGSLSPVFIGIMVAGMLAVIMSTADSWLNSLSVIISHDVIKKIYPRINEKQELLIARIATCICAGVAVLISFKNREILKLFVLVNSFSYTTIFIAFTMGFLKFKTNYISFLTSVISGIICTILAKFWVGEFGVVNMAIGFLGSTSGFFSAHCWQVKMGIIKIEKSIYQEYKPTLFQRIKQSINNFTALKKNVENNKSSYYVFALFIMALNIPILILGHNNVNDFINITTHYLRYLILFLALLLMMHELFTKKNPNTLWNLTLFLALPFFSTYLFIASGYGVVWGINCIVSMIALFLFANLYYAWLLGVFGILSAIALHLGYNFIIGQEPLLNMHANSNLFSTYSTVLLSIIVIHVIYHKFREDKEKQRALEILGRSIAHDVSTPLYTGLLNAGLIEEALKKKDYKKIEELVDSLKKCNKQAMQDIDIMLSSLKIDNVEKPTDWGRYSIIKCVNDALDNYYMSEEQRKQISFLDKNNKKDFKFVGSETLLKHVIFNLLKNAFKYAGPKAKIKLFIKDHKLHIKDTGSGMKKEVLANLFQTYVTTGGHGIGLNFCASAMLRMGGNITCNSKEGEGTEFILSFPH